MKLFSLHNNPAMASFELCYWNCIIMGIFISLIKKQLLHNTAPILLKQSINCAKHLSVSENVLHFQSQSGHLNVLVFISKASNFLIYNKFSFNYSAPGQHFKTG